MGLDAPLFYDDPINLVRGEGVWLFDDEDNRYLDLYNNVPCVGHANPRVVEAMGRQASKLNVHSRYLSEGVIAYAERLTGLLHDDLTSVVFTCTGTEANEVAIMMARAATGRRGIIGTDAGYHGNSAEVSKLTRLPAGTRRSNMRSIPTPQTFRPLQSGLSDDELCERYLDELRRQINAFDEDGVGFAGLLMCSILANEGLPSVPGPFFARAAEIVRDAGGLLIADEVQAGFARSGSWWGYETSGFRPDIVSLGKPMGNGLPLAGVVASHDIVSGFRANRFYFNTFAASPLQAAVGDAVITEIETRGLVDQVGRVGETLRQGLGQLQSDHPAMGEVRGHGLFIGIDWVTPGTTDPDAVGAAAVVEAMKSRHMLMGRAGQHGNVLKVRPPIVFDDEHANLFLATLADAVGSGERP
ncbi:MAG: aspartate aminotransferase family protein [Actinomycetia bacterium]|nr:aspartate aminotransferase family protein [Actinomycetes bacterium]